MSSRAIDRLRSRIATDRASVADLDSLQGDGDSGGYASMIGPMVSELASGAASIAASEKAKSDKAKKDAADKAAYQKSDEFAAKTAADAARKNADNLARAASTARAKAGVTGLPADDAAATNAEKLAKLAEIDAQSAESKLASITHTGGAGAGAGAGKGKAGGFKMPTWGWIALIGVGTLGVGAVGYKLLKK